MITTILNNGQRTLEKSPLNQAVRWIYNQVLIPAARPTARLLNKGKITANQVSASRMVFCFPIIYFLSALMIWQALCVYLVASYSDLVDGVMAREIERKTTAKGGFLDSLADKLMICTVFVFYWDEFGYLMPFLVVGEVSYAVLAALYVLLNNSNDESFERTKSNLAGKTKMVLEVLTTGLMLVQSEIGTESLEGAILFIGWTAFGLLTLSFLGKVKTTMDGAF